jgi:hypothetical protein
MRCKARRSAGSACCCWSVACRCGSAASSASRSRSASLHLQDHSETSLAETFRPICEKGTGIPAAAARAPNGPRPTVLFTRTGNAGQHYHWKGDDAWFPAAVETTQLVACFVTQKIMDTCSYDDATGPHTIATLQYVITGKVYAAKTGELLGEKIFTDGVPGKCPDSGASVREASIPSNDQLVAFVRGFVDQVDAER